MQDNNNKNPQDKKSRRRFDIVFFLVIIILIVAIFFLIRGFNTQNPESLDYQTFITALKDGKVTDVINATPVGGENYLLYNVTGTYINGNGDKVAFSINLTDSMLKDIISNADYSAYQFNFVALSSNVWLNILISFFPYLIIGIIFFFLFRSILKSQGGAGGAFDFAKSTAKLARGKSVTFKDVAGCDEEKEEMIEIVDFLKNPRKYNEIGARVPKGVILVGPPGTGKTLIAKAVAGEAGVPFFSISGSDFVEMFVGVGASRVRDMFKTAKDNAPCIIFIDEIDAVGRQRGAGLGGGHDEREQTLNQLLVEMDGFNGNTGIIIMAATNRPDVLDPALLRPGRFDRQITISNPDVRGREAILAVHARNKHLSPDVRLGDVAQRTPGFSGADLENLLNEAALLAARDNRKVITPNDIDEATDRVMMGPAKKSRKYTEHERKLVAYHEAGHAVVGICLENASQVQKITIVPRGQAGGYNLMMPKEETFFRTKTQILETITGFLGGRVAEELVFNEISTGASNDFQNATNLARSMVTHYGMSDLGPVQYEQEGGSVFLGRDYLKEKNFSDQVALEIDREQRRIIEECYERAKKVISENRELLTNIAEYLLKIETINKRDIDEIVATGHLQWCDEKYAPGVAPKEVNQDVKPEDATEVKEEAQDLGEATPKEKEFNVDDNLVEAPKEEEPKEE